MAKNQLYTDDAVTVAPGKFQLQISRDTTPSRTYTIKTVYVPETDKTLEDETNEMVVYDPKRPKIAFMLDNIPGKPRIDEMGVVRDSCPWTALFTVAAAVISLIPFGLCVKQVFELLKGHPRCSSEYAGGLNVA